MIPIIVEGKKVQIKKIKELNVSDLIELEKIEGLNIVKYIAWATGISNEDAFFTKIDRHVIKAVGTFPPIDSLPVLPKYLDYSVDTLGQRYQIESSNLQGYELVIFTLAVAMARSNNIDDVDRIVKELRERPYMEVLPAGVFFLKTLGVGKVTVRSIFRQTLMCLKIKILGKVLGLKP